MLIHNIITMKVAFCFLISYEQILIKEHIWKQWIEPNKDIINIYFHYKDFDTIPSEWVKKYALPKTHIVNTSYFHVVPAYLTLLSYAASHDRTNQWFCLLTDSCVPIISPLKFRELFFQYYNYTILDWKPCWWNIDWIHRANLRKLKKEYHLGHSPWFVLKREDVARCLTYASVNKPIYDLICKGGVGNESIFAIILQSFSQLDKVKKANTHVTDWSRMVSPTSPHIFIEGNEKDLDFINTFLKENKYTMFLRKISKEFPDEILIDYISKEDLDRERRVAKIRKLERKIFFLEMNNKMEAYRLFFLNMMWSKYWLMCLFLCISFGFIIIYNNYFA